MVIDRSLAALEFTALELAGVPVPQREAADSEGHRRSNVEVKKGYYGFAY